MADTDRYIINGNPMDDTRLINLHFVLVVVATMLGAGIVIEGLLFKWEFWMLPILAAGIVVMWVLYILQLYNVKTRETLYICYIMVAVLFHGVHESSFFDVSLIAVLMMITFSGLDNKKIQRYALIEYFIIMIIQFYLAGQNDGISKDVNTVARIILHIITVIIVSNVCHNLTEQRLKTKKTITDALNRAASANLSMEDFLSNISHEFRTPINVVTGMSSLLLKEKPDDKVYAISAAGHRLADQVGDILDYNEIIGNRLLITKDKYMVTSLVNDVIQNARPLAEDRDLELVVSVNPSVPMMLIGDVARIRKMMIHLVSNATKFTNRGGLFIGIAAHQRDYGVNLDIEITDTGKGMNSDEIASLSQLMYQADKGRDRSTGGIGLGLSIVYGFAHAMNGFVRVESSRNKGTTVFVSIPQEVADYTPCLSVEKDSGRCVVAYIKTEKYKIPEIREFYQRMIESISRGLRVPVHGITSFAGLKSLLERLNVTNLFMGQEEYEENRRFFVELSEHMCVAVNTSATLTPEDGNVLFMPKPLYGIPIVNILNAGDTYMDFKVQTAESKPVFTGVRALIVDDEVMNLVVASGLFVDYEMITETAGSGKEAIAMVNDGEYDVIFMDHMMPEMDGVEAMKRIREVLKDKGREAIIIALTANAVSGAREMFISEGFDGFIAKPIEILEFERVLKTVLPAKLVHYRGEGSEE